MPENGSGCVADIRHQTTSSCLQTLEKEEEYEICGFSLNEMKTADLVKHISLKLKGKKKKSFPWLFKNKNEKTAVNMMSMLWDCGREPT